VSTKNPLSHNLTSQITSQSNNKTDSLRNFGQLVYLEEPPAPIQKKTKPSRLTKSQKKKQFRRAVEELADKPPVHKRKRSRRFKKRLLWHQAKEEIKWLQNKSTNKDSK
jgi:hypothetical protein